MTLGSLGYIPATVRDISLPREYLGIRNGGTPTRPSIYPITKIIYSNLIKP